MNLKALITLLAVLNALTVFGQAGGSITVEKQLNETVNKAGLKFVGNPVHVGLSIGIVDNGKSYTYNYGTIEKEKSIRPTARTIYEIASITKSFTGILLAHAVLEKKISLNDDVTKYLDGPYPGLSFNGQPVKIIHLANHTAGLPKNVPDYSKALSPEQILNRYQNFSEKQFLTAIADYRITTVPGTQFNYSNAGAQLIGIILERVYHMSYGDLVRKYITGPAHMNHTGLFVNSSEQGGFAKGYNEKGVQMPLLTQWTNIPAAGSIKSNIQDLLTYLKININENDPAIALAHHVTFKNSEENGDDVGLFWFVKTLPGDIREVKHAGGGFGTTTYCLLYPSRNVGIICLCNDASAVTEHELTAMAHDILTQSGVLSKTKHQ